MWLTTIAATLACAAVVQAAPTVEQARSTVDAHARCEALGRADFTSVVDAPTQVTATESVESRDGVVAHCAVRGYVAPQVGFELWLPLADWNHKFLYAGCGGSCGVLLTAACEEPVRRGYACIVGDMGHQTGLGDSLWSYNNLQAEYDFAIRATHVTALAGKAIAKAFYDAPLKKAYFAGCSNGGLQAMTEAQRFPWDFDGIIAGSPGISETNYYLDMLWNLRALYGKDGAPILRPEDLRLVHAAVLQRCDMDDGAKDGIVGNPQACDFRPTELVCKAGQTSHCLSTPQAAAVSKIYSGPVTSDGKHLTPGGASVGSELSWIPMFLGEGANGPVFTLESVAELFRYRALVPDPGPAWRAEQFDFDRDAARLGMMEALYSGTNPDLRKFKAAGGKLLIYQGWADPLALPRETIDYYETLERTMGGRAATREFARLFMVPGMEHCSGGAGAFAIDYLSYLEQWVEQGHAPEMMLGAHVAEASSPPGRGLSFPLPRAAVAFERPVYPYPDRARYSGSGAVNEAGRWTRGGN